MIAMPLCLFDPIQCLKGAFVLAISFAEHSCNTRMSGCKLITTSRFFANPILQFQETIRIAPRLLPFYVSLFFATTQGRWYRRIIPYNAPKTALERSREGNR